MHALACTFGHVSLFPLTLGGVVRALLGPLPELAVTLIVELHRAGGMAMLWAITAGNIVHFLLIYNQSWINKFPDKQIMRGIIFSSLLFAFSPMLANYQVRDLNLILISKTIVLQQSSEIERKNKVYCAQASGEIKCG